MSKAKTSPTKRTLDYTRAVGWIPDVVERWIPRVNVRKDLFGFLDLVVMDDKGGLLGIQATSDESGGNSGARMEKISNEPRAVEWLRRGLRLEVWGWRKLRGRWRPKRFTARLLADDSIEWDDAEEVARG